MCKVTSWFFFLSSEIFVHISFHFLMMYFRFFSLFLLRFEGSLYTLIVNSVFDLSLANSFPQGVAYCFIFFLTNFHKTHMLSVLELILYCPVMNDTFVIKSKNAFPISENFVPYIFLEL